MNMVNVLANGLVWDKVYKCGTGAVHFEGIFPSIVHTIYLILEIGIPVILIIFGMLDLGRAVMASKEEEIKKNQNMFLKRLVSALLVFLVLFAVKLGVRFVTQSDKHGEGDIADCISCFINNVKCDSVADAQTDSEGQ